MKKNIAAYINAGAKKAIAELDTIVKEIQGNCSDQEFQVIKRGVGNSMVAILNGILEPIYAIYPDLDDLKDKTP